MDEQNLNPQGLEQDFPVSDAPAVNTPDPNEIDVTKPIVPKRERRPSPRQTFKEERLPFIILGVAAVLIVSFIFGSISRGITKSRRDAENARIAELLSLEAEGLKAEAALLAAEYDYEGAMDVLASYSAGLNSDPVLKGLYDQYKTAQEDLVVWDDFSQIPNLSFRTLVADLDKAAADPDRGSRYKKNYITTDEFTSILEQLYANGYVLVSVYDFAQPSSAEDGSVTVSRSSIRLPAGKKPIILTQEGVNYYSHMEKCGGFADCLTLGSDGELTCLMTGSDGAMTEGNFDLVPVLNAFLAEHPDFSYEGARATIAVSGYQGLFGMELDQTESIQAVAKKLRDQGYDIACYTYADMEYADYGVVGLQEDLDKWFSEITPLLGDVDILVYPTGGDIAGQGSYSGSRYDALHGYGFRYFIGTGSGDSWGMTTNQYARQQRTIVTAANLASNPEWYAGLFDASAVLSPARG